MENSNLQSPCFALVILFLCFIFFKISLSAIHSSPLKVPILEIHESLPYFFINDAG